MARLWSSGFELNSTTNGVEWTGSSGSPTIQTSVVRSGTYALNIGSLQSTFSQFVRWQFLNTEAASNRYFRTYLRVATLPSAENSILLWNDSASVTGTPSVYVTIDNGGELRLYDEDGQITGTTTLSIDTWYRVEVHINTTPVGGSQVVEAMVDGVTFASSSTRNIASTNSPFSFWVGGNLLNEAQTTGTWYIDDVAVNSATGSFQNSWPGEGSIIHLKPNAAGDNNGFAKNGGGAGDSNNFNQVDELTPDDATSNLESTGVNGIIDDYNLEATPAAIGSGDTINLVHVGYRGRAEAAGDGDGVSLRIKSTSSGTVETGSSIVMNGTTWRTNAVTTPQNYTLTLYDLPGASTTAWTKADLDTAQIGMIADDTGGVASEASTLWLLVEYVPVPSPAPATGATALMMGV
jgi:hypothetical protein